MPQECATRGHRQFDFVMSEADLHLPRVQIATRAGNVALSADPRECRFRLPTIADSRFGLMLASEGGRLKPVLLAPLLGGPESRLHAGESFRFVVHCVVRAGNWKETYAAHRARHPRLPRSARQLGAWLAECDPRTCDGLPRRPSRRQPRALGRSAEILRLLHRQDRRVQAVLAALRPLRSHCHRRRDVLPAPGAACGRGGDFPSHERLRPLRQCGQQAGQQRRPDCRCPLYRLRPTGHASRAVPAPHARISDPGGSERSDEGALSDALARWRLTGEAAALAEARRIGERFLDGGSVASEESFFDLLELADTTREPRHRQAALDAAYHVAAKLNLYPIPPDANVVVDRDGSVPVHFHSFGRHHNVWGFPPPRPLLLPEQTVPAWRIARLGLPGTAYPIEYWMNTHGALLRVAGLAHDELLRDLSRWGMVGRFGNYPGDNRSQDSLVAERPDAVDRKPWDWNFATVNPGHAWDFAGAVLDFLVSDAFERSRGAVDFPAFSAAGSHFRVRIYGGKPGRFHGDEGVHLWLPRGLVTSDNRQVDWLAGYGNDQLYLALWNQSSRAEEANLSLDEALVQCDATREARSWQDNVAGPPARVVGNRLTATLAPKGIVAFAIPATVKPRLQARLYDEKTAALGLDSFAQVAAPFGPVHALLLNAGRGLTSAFVYTEALPEHVIAARLRWRQGDGAWHLAVDDIYPYEFSPELNEDGGDFECVFEVEDTHQKIQSSPRIGLKPSAGRLEIAPVNAVDASIVPVLASPPLAGITPPAPAAVAFDCDDAFLAYLQRAANRNDFGLARMGAIIPIPHRKAVASPGGSPSGTRPSSPTVARPRKPSNTSAPTSAASTPELRAVLAARPLSVDIATLDQRQRDTLLDLALTEGVTGLRAELIDAVLAHNWTRIIDELLYVRYAGHAPDHDRNKAFAERLAHSLSHPARHAGIGSIHGLLR